MIGWLKGEILEKQAPLLILNVQGVGYEINAPMTTFYQLPEQGVAELFIHMVVREDAQLLYGFANKDDKRLFQALIKVNGVGPKLALAILSSIEPADFVACVQHDDVNALVKIPGIGKKTAERLLIEMRDRLKDWFMADDALLTSGDANAVVALPSVTQEAESALIALGYKPQEAAKMLQKIQSEHEFDTVEALIKAALKQVK